MLFILFFTLVSALTHLELSKNAELLEQTTNVLIDKIKAEIVTNGYMCWNRDQTLFTYALITARTRKPSRGTREIEICSYHDIDRIRGGMQSVYESIVAYNDEFDAMNYLLWLQGLLKIYRARNGIT